jgi:parallel beta-helix repeat protein
MKKVIFGVLVLMSILVISGCDQFTPTDDPQLSGMRLILQRFGEGGGGGGGYIPPAVGCGDTITEDTILTDDLLNCPGNGLVIENDDVTLDCDGHIISGQGGGPTIRGIQVLSAEPNPPIENVIIKNCIIKNFYHGIFLYGASGANILDNEIRDNHNDGIWIGWRSDNSIVSNNLIEKNEGNGISIDSGVPVDVFRNMIINNNNGLVISGGTKYLEDKEDSYFDYNFVGNYISNNTDGGFATFYAGKINFSRNIVVNNADGLRLRLIYAWNEFTYNTISNNDFGIRVFDSESSPTCHLAFVMNRISDNIVNAYSDMNNGGHTYIVWYNEGGGNYWSDFVSNPGYPLYYEISGGGQYTNNRDYNPLCFDMTLGGGCSVTKPLFCESGELIEDCQACGCNPGFECQSDGSCE